jgi:hypothetical protein
VAEKPGTRNDEAQTDAAGAGDADVSGRSKPASQGRIKTSQFEGILIGQGAHQDETLTGEPSQIEPATIDINSAPGGMVQPGYCA